MDEYYKAVTEDMLRMLQSESIGEGDIRTLRNDQIRLADWLLSQEKYDEALEQYERAAALDEDLLRRKRTSLDMRNAVRDFLRIASVLSFERSKGDPAAVYEKALEAASVLREEADPEAASLAAAANYGIACSLWGGHMYAKSLMYYDRAIRENGGDVFSHTVGLPPEERLELQKCYAAVLERLKEQGGQEVRPESLLRMSGGEVRSSDELEMRSCYSETAASVLFDMGRTKGAIREQRACIAFGLQLLEKRRIPGDYVRLRRQYTALADMLAAGDTSEKEESLFTKKLAEHVGELGRKLADPS